MDQGNDKKSYDRRIAVILQTKNLAKSFKTGKEIVESVKDVSIAVNAQEIFGFIGPNGAGKTTTMRMLTTLLQPTAGSAKIAGFDVVDQPHEIRKVIGYVSQSGGLDQCLNARENLVFQGQLYGLTTQDASKRADELIVALQLEPFAHRHVSTYSGGQRRRVEIAMALIHRPQLLFLDEPTTGLDPQTRAHLWQEILKIREQGTTIFLTTHYLDEVDALCDRIAIIDHGVIVAEGTANALKKAISGDVIILGVTHAHIDNVHNLIKREPYVLEIIESKEGLRISVEHGPQALPQLVRLLDNAALDITNITLSKPSLDDVFLKQTGRTLREQTY